MVVVVVVLLLLLEKHSMVYVYTAVSTHTMIQFCFPKSCKKRQLFWSSYACEFSQFFFVLVLNKNGSLCIQLYKEEKQAIASKLEGLTHRKPLWPSCGKRPAMLPPFSFLVFWIIYKRIMFHKAYNVL